LNYRSLEFRLLLECSIEHRPRPYGWSRIKALGMNLEHSLAMDSEVRFEKGCHYKSFDVHFEPEIFEKLALIMRELVYPFLNDYYAGREVSLFKNDVSPNVAIMDSVHTMMEHVTKKGLSPLLLDRRGEMLLGQILLWKAETEQRRGLSAGQLEVFRNLNEIRRELVNEENAFKGIIHYAKMANMSISKFKTGFKRETGFAPYVYWNRGQLQRGLLKLLTTRMSVMDIALEVGYNDTAAFDKAFRKVFEESPSDYRKRMGSL
jgi:AraC-like DNA-binding protein